MTRTSVSNNSNVLAQDVRTALRFSPQRVSRSQMSNLSPDTLKHAQKRPFRSINQLRSQIPEHVQMSEHCHK